MLSKLKLKRAVGKICWLIFMLFLSSEIYPQWVQADGPYGGRINCIAAGTEHSGSANLFAGTEHGLYLSTNNGASWTLVNSEFENSYINSLAVSGANIFAATSEHFNGSEKNVVYLSTNNGMSWKYANNGLPQDARVSSLAISGTNIFAGTTKGVFLSTDNGTSWTSVNNNLSSIFSNPPAITALAVSGTDLIAGTCCIGGLALSTNNGSNWTCIDAGMSNKDIRSLAVSGTKIFAGTSKGVILSTNNGMNWTSLNSGLKDNWGNIPRICALAINGNIIAAGTWNGGAFISTNNGEGWTAANSGLACSYINALAVSGTNIFAGTWGGLFLSTNNGKNWIAANNGIKNTHIGTLDVIGEKLFAGIDMGKWEFGFFGGGIHTTTDEGKSWIAANAGLIDTCGYVPNIFVITSNRTNIFTGTSNGVFLSTNNGLNWISLNSNRLKDKWGNIPIISALTLNGTNIFAGTWWSGVYLSINNGVHWTSVLNGLPQDNLEYYLGISSFAISGTNIFAGTGNVVSGSHNGVYISTNNGENWIYSGLSNLYVYALEVSGTNIFAGTDQGVFLSADNGKNWKSANSGINKNNSGSLPSVFTIAECGNSIFIGTSGGVYLSTNNGTKWTAINYGLLSKSGDILNVKALAVSGNKLFAGTEYSGVWIRPVSEIVTSVHELSNSELPQNFLLEQNYPNPFNPATTIKFSLPYPSHVTLNVYDLLGSKVATLIDEEKPAGIHNAVWKADNISSGIYFYRIKAGNYNETKKMILMR